MSPSTNAIHPQTRVSQSETSTPVAVEAIDRALERIQKQGGRICVPKMAIPTIGWLAYAEDPAGNVFGVLEPDSEVK